MSDTGDEVERLRARVANLERMADRLAHELTTPLTTTHGFARVLLRGDLPADVRSGLERIERASGTALAMLRSRMDEGVGDGPRSVRLRTLVRDAVTAALGDRAMAGHGLPEDARVFVDLASMQTALGLLLGAVAEHAAARSVDPSGLTVELVQERDTAHQVRIELDAPPLPVDAVDAADPDPDASAPSDVASRLRRAEVLFAAHGARLWIDPPRTTLPRVALLLELPRDVQT